MGQARRSPPLSAPKGARFGGAAARSAAGASTAWGGSVALAVSLTGSLVMLSACGDSGGTGGGGTGGNGTGASGTGAGTTSQGGGGSGGGGPTAECIPANLTGPLPGECAGVFVKAGGTGTGTMAEPFGSVADALAAVPSKGVIYVCYDAATRLNESVTIGKDVTILGRLDCDTATKAAGPSLLGGTGVAPSIKISTGVDVYLADLDVTSPDLSGIAMPNGESSAVVWVDGGSVDIERCVLAAGKGAPGKTEVEDMTVVPKPAAAPAPGMTDGAQNGCDGTTAVNSGGLGGSNTCGGVMVGGGLGGSGTNGGTGGSGIMGDWITGAVCQVAEPLCGQPGAGQGASVCTNGKPGGIGVDGEPGAGASSDGALASSSFQGAPGAPGVGPGQAGGGGGGGGGAKQCSGAGPGGGGGGAGGCGGAAGPGGGGGGGSFALVSVMGSVSHTDTSLTAGVGGQGGGGAPGQKGALGGVEGTQGSGGGACAGGPGGNGGRGGAGGGGRGGPSVGIAYTGTMPTLVGTGNMITVAAAAAPGGAGGSGDPAGLGAAGLLEATYEF